MDTIFALASGGVAAGVAVYRISGPQAGEAVRALTGRPLPPPRQAVLRTIRRPAGADRGGPGEKTGPDGVDPEAIDRGLVLWFPAPHSFTGEDVAELHLHGGRAVREAVYAALGALPGLRLAEPGEFTRRAFENGRLDLTQAEGLADLVAAETEGQRRQALRQMQGALGARYAAWRAELAEALALLEAEIDFADEDLPADAFATVRPRLRALAAALRAHLADGGRGERLREGVQVAILGAPNVGKSSLVNALARREVAIVTELAGTTRDVLEVALDLDGVPVVLADTAGLRDSVDPVEREGVRRARARAEAADILLVLLDATAFPALPAELAPLLAGERRVLLAANKTDLKPLPQGAALYGRPVLPLSVRSGAGLAELVSRLAEEAVACAAPAAEAGITRARHREAVTDCLAAVERALAAAAAPELVAEDVRLAARALGRITGQVGVEEVLDLVFARFCIGK